MPAEISIHDAFGPRVDDVEVAALAAYLDGLGAEARVREVRSLSRNEQARLFDAAFGERPISLEHLVPAGTPPLTEVVHFGRNSLPAFRIFEKRFCRPPEGGGELWGYNEHGARWMTGPGYFVAAPNGPMEVLIDYLRVPPAKPDSWPPIRPNSAPRGRFVYGGTQDLLRAVSDHVSVGRATKGGRPRDNWFVLCRA